MPRSSDAGHPPVRRRDPLDPLDGGGGAGGQPEPAVGGEALLRGEVVDVGLGRVEPQPAGRRGGVDRAPAPVVGAVDPLRLGIATPVDVSLWVRRRGRRRPRPPAAGACPARSSASTARRGTGPRRTPSANFDENSPNTRCWLRRSIRPNDRRVPERRGAAVAEQHLVAVGQGEQLGDAVAQAADHEPDRALAVARPQVVGPASAASAVDRLGPDLGRPARRSGRRAGSRSAGMRISDVGPLTICHYRGRSSKERNPLAAHLRTGRRHRRIGHAGRRRQGEGAQGGRRAGHRLRRRRARLPDARPTSSRRPSRPAATREPPLHAGRRPARAEGGHRRQDAARLRLRGRRPAR